MNTLKPGTQIIYVPRHVNGDLSDPACQCGFVTYDPRDEMVGNSGVFCRYFYGSGELRTTSCSECTPIDMLVVADTRQQAEIDLLMDELGYDNWRNNYKETE